LCISAYAETTTLPPIAVSFSRMDQQIVALDRCWSLLV